MIRIKNILKRSAITASAVFVALSLAGAPLAAAAKVEDDAIYTEEGYEDYMAEISRNKAQAIQTNLDPGWPQGPAVGAAGAVVMDADSGAVLYGKNMEKHLYPASITKIMTALLAYENLDPTDTVTFSENAVFGIERGSSNIGIDVGESISVDQALYGLMVASANEVAIALGERVSGTESDFVSLMNERAVELGCKNTHFVTTNGLHDSDHYTCAYDMALIAREIYKYPDLIEYMSQLNYHFEADKNQPDDFWIGNTNDFLNGSISCDDVVGGKTGYTDQARETLVTFAERDGKRLICVIMREEPPYQYYDTIDLLDYAFDNFKQVNIAKAEDRFTQNSRDFLKSGPDIFGNSAASYYISENDMLMIPKNASFSDLSAEIFPLSYGPETQVNQEKETENKENKENKEAETQNGPDTESDSPGKNAEESKESGSTNAAGESAGNNTGDNSGDSAGKTAGENAKDSAGKTAGDNTGDITEDTSGDASTTQETAATKAESTSAVQTPPASSAKQEDGSRIVGVIQYKFHDYNLGTANVLFRSPKKEAETASDVSGEGSTTATADISLPSGSDRTAKDTPVPEEVHGIRALFFGFAHTGLHGSVYLNILFLIPLLLAFTFLLCVIFFIHDHFAQRTRRLKAKQRRAQGIQGANRQKQGTPKRTSSRRYDSENAPRRSDSGSRPGRNTARNAEGDTYRNKQGNNSRYTDRNSSLSERPVGSHDRSSGKSYDKSPERSYDRSSGRSYDRSSERPYDKSSGRSYDRSPERSYDRSSGRSFERSSGKSDRFDS